MGATVDLVPYDHALLDNGSGAMVVPGGGGVVKHIRGHREAEHLRAGRRKETSLRGAAQWIDASVVADEFDARHRIGAAAHSTHLTQQRNQLAHLAGKEFVGQVEEPARLGNVEGEVINGNTIRGRQHVQAEDVDQVVEGCLDGVTLRLIHVHAVFNQGEARPPGPLDSERDQKDVMGYHDLNQPDQVQMIAAPGVGTDCKAGRSRSGIDTHVRAAVTPVKRGLTPLFARQAPGGDSASAEPANTVEQRGVDVEQSGVSISGQLLEKEPHGLNGKITFRRRPRRRGRRWEQGGR